MDYARSRGWITTAARPSRPSRQSRPLQPAQSIRLTAGCVAGLAADPSTDAIIAAVSKFTGIPVEQLLDKSTRQPREFFTRARVITAGLLRTRVGLTYQQIGALMHRHHKAVMYLCHRFGRN